MTMDCCRVQTSKPLVRIAKWARKKEGIYTQENSGAMVKVVGGNEMVFDHKSLTPGQRQGDGTWKGEIETPRRLLNKWGASLRTVGKNDVPQRGQKKGKLNKF